MSLRETARYAALGAAAALLVSGGIYAGSAFQAQQTSARASDGYSGNFDHVQKQGGGSGSDAPADDDTSAESGAAGAQQGTAAASATPYTPANSTASTPTTGSDEPDPAPTVDPTPAPVPSADTSGDVTAPTQDQEADAEEPATEAEPGEPPAAPEPAADPDPAPGDDPTEPGGGGIAPGPAIFKAVNPCLLVKCDPPPPPGNLTLDPCLVIQCAVADDQPVFIPTIDYSKLPSLQLDLRK